MNSSDKPRTANSAAAETTGLNPFQWGLEVVDASGREREWKIGVRDGRVVSLPPPGEGFVIKNPRYAAAAILQATEQADRQRGEA